MAVVYMVVVMSHSAAECSFESHEVQHTYCAGVYHTREEAEARAQEIQERSTHQVRHHGRSWYRQSTLMSHEVRVVEIPMEGGLGIELSRTEFDYTE